MYHIDLPWPPSVNSYWRNVGGRAILSRKGRDYQRDVGLAVLVAGRRQTLTCAIELEILAYPPDRRRRDLDNLCKGVLDGLQKARVYEDDFQICKLTIERCRVSKPGRLEVTIRELSGGRHDAG